MNFKQVIHTNSLWVFRASHMFTSMRTWRWVNVTLRPGGSEGKAYAYNAGDLGSIPGLGRSPGEGNGTPLQYSSLENPMDEKPGRLQAMGSQRDRHDWVTSLSLLRHNTMSIYLFRTLPMGGMSRSCKVRVELIHWLWSQQAIKTHIKML